MMTHIDRRAFFGLAGAGGASLLLFGRSGRAAGDDAFRGQPHARRMAEDARAAALSRCCAKPATERPFTSPLLKEHRRGTFVCAGCALPLFSSATKFESGTGWPSFWKPLPGAVVDAHRPQPADGAHRSAVRALRRPSRPRLRRRPEADRPALLHERAGAELPRGLSG